MRIFASESYINPQEMIKEAIIPQTLLLITLSSPSSGTEEAQECRNRLKEHLFPSNLLLVG
jgi:hypothetical protein